MDPNRASQTRMTVDEAVITTLIDHLVEDGIISNAEKSKAIKSIMTHMSSRSLYDLIDEKSILPLPEPLVPVVDPANSVFPDHIICLIDGKKKQFLQRHILQWGLKPDDYRRLFNLPADYPMAIARSRPSLNVRS